MAARVRVDHKLRPHKVGRVGSDGLPIPPDDVFNPPIAPGFLGYWWRSDWWVNYWFASNWWSSGFGAVPDPAPVLVPGQPGGLSLTLQNATSVGMSWAPTPPLTQTSFEVQRSLDGASWTTVATLPGNATAYVDTGLSQATLYYYQIIATNASGDSAPSQYANIMTPNPATQTAAGRVTGLATVVVVNNGSTSLSGHVSSSLSVTAGTPPATQGASGHTSGQAVVVALNNGVLTPSGNISGSALVVPGAPICGVTVPVWSNTLTDAFSGPDSSGGGALPGGGLTAVDPLWTNYVLGGRFFATYRRYNSGGLSFFQEYNHTAVPDPATSAGPGYGGAASMVWASQSFTDFDMQFDYVLPSIVVPQDRAVRVGAFGRSIGNAYSYYDDCYGCRLDSTLLTATATLTVGRTVGGGAQLAGTAGIGSYLIFTTVTGLPKTGTLGFSVYGQGSQTAILVRINGVTVVNLCPVVSGVFINGAGPAGVFASPWFTGTVGAPINPPLSQQPSIDNVIFFGNP